MIASALLALSAALTMACCTADATPAGPVAPITHAEALRQRLGADAALPLWPADRWPLPAGLDPAVDFVAAPGLATTRIGHPHLLVFRPRHPNGRALIAVPGGGYHFVSVDNEGLAVAQTFVPRGYTVFVLIYRLPTEGWAGPTEVALADAQRAVRMVRARAAEYRIDPARIGVMGFSAGGQLVSDLATAYGREVVAPTDATDRLSARPDWVALIYPVIMLEPPYTHTDTFRAMGGATGDVAALERHGAIRHVGADTPPVFLLHAADDPVVPVANSLLFAQAMAAARRPVELHVVPHGGHGFGARADAATLLGHWCDLVLDWRARVERWPDQER